MADDGPLPCALDIGGTLAKVALLRPDSVIKDAKWIDNVNHPSLTKLSPHNKIVCLHFKTSEMDKLIEFLRVELESVKTRRPLFVTGGGAFKYQETLEKALPVSVKKCDEMRSAMIGLSFVAGEPEQVYIHNLETKAKSFATFHSESERYPTLLVNIGSGVSIVKATSPDDFVRISGTCIGGGTVMGLARTLIQAKDFDEICELASQGMSSLDLKVNDLFGDCAGGSALPPDTLASSFGILGITQHNYQSLRNVISKPDIAHSLITMVSYNLGYLAYLLGRIHMVGRLIFTGKYINNRQVTIAAIAEAVRFYTEQYGTKSVPETDAQLSFQVLSLKLDGYLGAIGALIQAGEAA